jgi:hypothetical protein
MPKISPWHSKEKMDKPIYHNNTACTKGKNIETKNRGWGTGGHPLCEDCAGLNKQGK